MARGPVRRLFLVLRTATSLDPARQLSTSRKAASRVLKLLNSALSLIFHRIVIVGEQPKV
jgi:hypothetical protein